MIDIAITSTPGLLCWAQYNSIASHDLGRKQRKHNAILIRTTKRTKTLFLGTCTLRMRIKSSHRAEENTTMLSRSSISEHRTPRPNTASISTNPETTQHNFATITATTSQVQETSFANDSAQHVQSNFFTRNYHGQPLRFPSSGPTHLRLHWRLHHPNSGSSKHIASRLQLLPRCSYARLQRSKRR